jgi:hypothetical protein
MFPFAKAKKRRTTPPGGGVPLSDLPVSPSETGIEPLILIVHAWKVILCKHSGRATRQAKTHNRLKLETAEN